jgi:hypothetical protein
MFKERRFIFDAPRPAPDGQERQTVESLEQARRQEEREVGRAAAEARTEATTACGASLCPPGFTPQPSRLATPQAAPGSPENPTEGATGLPEGISQTDAQRAREIINQLPPANSTFEGPLPIDRENLIREIEATSQEIDTSAATLIAQRFILEFGTHAPRFQEYINAKNAAGPPVTVNLTYQISINPDGTIAYQLQGNSVADYQNWIRTNPPAAPTSTPESTSGEPRLPLAARKEAFLKTTLGRILGFLGLIDEKNIDDILEGKGEGIFATAIIAMFGGEEYLAEGVVDDFREQLGDLRTSVFGALPASITSRMSIPQRRDATALNDLFGTNPKEDEKNILKDLGVRVREDYTPPEGQTLSIRITENTSIRIPQNTTLQLENSPPIDGGNKGLTINPKYLSENNKANPIRVTNIPAGTVIQGETKDISLVSSTVAPATPAPSTDTPPTREAST